MSIYNQINKNKWRTGVIFFIFIFLLSGFFFLMGKFFESPTTYFLTGLFLSFFTGGLSYFYSDKIVLFTVGAKPADKKEHFDFYTVTENLSIAAGIPMPKLYVIEDEAMNAFATGRNPKNAVVCATTGLLNKLERAEIEGVIAHELSHIKNYDILLASVVSVLVGMISLVSDWIIRKFWWTGRLMNKEENEKQNPLLAIFFAFVLITAPIVATLIQLAISRRREYLADASGALLTRYPEGLARALEKISAENQPLSTASLATAHLFISNPFKKKNHFSWLVNLFSTHPPIEERIRILRDM
ncbi:MAG: M48 family metallopeptidase [Patescibacteria group bacterium]|nr:M48 family metallopeptidase [Patescibacteria group bacterium]